MLSIDTAELGHDAAPKVLQTKEIPFFHDLKADIDGIKNAAGRYGHYKKIILVGNGGAVNSFLVLHRALYRGGKEVVIINSMEPDLLGRIRNKHTKEDSLVIVSSTSGTNVGALEIMSFFIGYPMVVLTADNDGALRNIAKAMGIETIPVPQYTDRFETGTALAYFPMAVLGMDIGRIDSALHEAYSNYSPDRPDNDALKLSNALLSLEEKGYTEVFVPIYSNSLEGFAVYITQLMHESVCKDGRGQSFFVARAPESQHHTNQRFFGGRKNICGIFIRAANQEDSTTKVRFPSELESTKLREGSLGDISNVPLARSFEFEFEGTYRDAVSSNIPCCVISLDRIDEENVAQLIAFWHYTAVYSCWLRDVNPFDQPAVEKSKQIAFELRKGYKE